ncbi:MAG: hypothetical protein UZ14_CFX002002884 [Chloroflexi bacterium OLB14]|nr:MAG: hypothetical protein UZ14_CFX002002884 [Chloroflexi bacterium OLB14]
MRLQRRKVDTMGKSKNPNNKVDVEGDVSGSVVITGSGNTVNIKKPNSPKHGDSWQWFIIILLIIVVAVIVFKLFSSAPLSDVTGTKSPTPVEATTSLPSLTANPTASPTDTETPIPPTQTSIPTVTSTPTFTPIPPVPLGEDLTQGCISKLWSAYPTTVPMEDKGNGCWKEPLHAFSADDGKLEFLFERQNGGEEIYGLFVPLPIEKGSITFTIRLEDLSNADLLMGVFSQPEVKSQGLLMMMLNGGVESNVFIRKNPITYETITGSRKISQGSGYSITFRFDNLSVRSVVNPAVFFIDPISLPASQKYLFLGYKGLNGYYRIEGTFLNFEVKP